jgi:hypothetical protein
VTRWQRYWFDDGGRHALAIVRFCVALAVLGSLARLAGDPTPVAPEGLYRPIGIWMLFGASPPSPVVLAILAIVAWLATLAMLLGRYTRVATATSFATGVALAAASCSHQEHWSHVHNVVFLAQLALLGARAGDALSLDAWLRHCRGQPPIDRPRAYQWSLRLVQLAVALMFVGAAVYKLAYGHFTLSWALSDNLRHHLLVRYDLAGIERSPLADWLLQASWRYRGAALLNLVTQSTPLFAILCVRRPAVRALAGLAFVVEVIGLGLVVDLWNLHWLPLAAVFVDWEWLLRVPGRVPREARVPRGPRIFVAGFVVYDICTTFVPTLDQRLNTYPFSSFPMFASMRVREPYDAHLPYAVPGDRFDAGPISPAAQRFLDHHYRGTYLIEDPVRLHAQLARIRHDMNTHYFPDQHITRLAHYRVRFEVPAYPAPARFERHDIAITAVLDGDKFVLHR